MVITGDGNNNDTQGEENPADDAEDESSSASEDEAELGFDETATLLRQQAPLPSAPLTTKKKKKITMCRVLVISLLVVMLVLGISHGTVKIRLYDLLQAVVGSQYHPTDIDGG